MHLEVFCYFWDIFFGHWIPFRNCLKSTGVPVSPHLWAGLQMFSLATWRWKIRKKNCQLWGIKKTYSVTTVSGPLLGLLHSIISNQSVFLFIKTRKNNIRFFLPSKILLLIKLYSNIMYFCLYSSWYNSPLKIKKSLAATLAASNRFFNILSLADWMLENVFVSHTPSLELPTCLCNSTV